MTATVNGNRPHTTVSDDGGDVRARPRTPGNGAHSDDERRSSAYTRVIPGLRSKVKHAHVSLSRSVTEHADDLVQAAGRTGTLTEAPASIAEAWRQVFPAPGECGTRTAWLRGTVGGLFRALVTTVCFGLVLAVGTRLRAQVGLAVFLLCAAAVAVGGLLT